MMISLLSVALGGAIGSMLRFAAVQTIGGHIGTLAVNVLGSFFIGFLFVAIEGRMHLSPILMTGILGGFTTFSAFSLDTLKLLQAGQTLQALAYVGASIILSLAAVALGAALAKGVLS